MNGYKARQNMCKRRGHHIYAEPDERAYGPYAQHYLKCKVCGDLILKADLENEKGEE